VADYLTKKGVPFRTAHEITGALVLGCIKAQRAIDDLTLDELKAYSDVFDSSVFEAISLETCVNGRCVKGGPAEEAVKAHIAYAEGWLKAR